MPEAIGVLTSQTGSVIRDIINVSTRRNPNVYIKLLPVPVQGEEAAEKIIKIMEEMLNGKRTGSKKRSTAGADLGFIPDL